ncbi:hypothetical protein PTKIN_Ptkin14bG0051800 [Pterospermum kingtungense]
MALMVAIGSLAPLLCAGKSPTRDEKIAIFSDELNHASIVDGIKLADRNGWVECFVYKHCDVSPPSTLLVQYGRGLCTIVELVLRKKHGFLFVLDDAHGTLVLGKNGGGVAEEFNCEDDIDICVGTLSKGAASRGGFIACSFSHGGKKRTMAENGSSEADARVPSSNRYPSHKSNTINYDRKSREDNQSEPAMHLANLGQQQSEMESQRQWLSRRVQHSRSALWEAFEAYGRVADVFISFRSKRPFCFAFVSYRSVDECRRAVRGGNGRRNDESVVMVKEASFGWKERCSVKEPKSHMKGLPVIGLLSGALGIKGLSRKFSWQMLWRLDESKGVHGSPNMQSQGIFSEEILLDIDIPAQETEWLSCSVFAATKDNVLLDDVTDIVSKLGCNGVVSPIGGISVCVTFDSQRARDDFIDKIQLIEDSPLFDMLKWNGDHQKLIYVWVLIEDVPFRLWNIRFFEQLGNIWGSSIRIDDCTMKKNRLDGARILIKVDTQLGVPLIATVVVNGEKFKISVPLEEIIGADYKDIFPATDDGTQATGSLPGLEGQTKRQKTIASCIDDVRCMGSDRVSVSGFP